MRTRCRMGGFTLVELLVVIAIIGVLVALLLPAVQAAREAARRSSCSNNLKQISLGLHNYHDTYKSFPSGWILARNSSGGIDSTKPGWGWGALLLPFVEQAPMHDQLQVSTEPFGWGNDPADPDDMVVNGQNLTQTKLDVFVCPSDVSAELNERRNNHAKANYAGVFGNGGRHKQNPGNGLFFADSKLGFRDITDGSSNTLAVGEVIYSGSSTGKAGAIWAGYFDDGKYGGLVWQTDNTAADRINGTDDFCFSSRHPGGAQFALADASVRFISETIDGVTWENVGQRNDGNPATLP